METRIAGQIGVAQSSVREALHELEREGLVERVPGVGAKVTTLTQGQIDQIYALRAELEGYAVELVGRRSDPADLEALNGRLEACRQAVDESPLAFMMADLEFHMELWRRAGNEFLLELISRIVMPLFAFETRAVMPSLSRQELQDNLESHVRIIRLLEHGEAGEARLCMARCMSEFQQQTRGLSREPAAAGEAD